MNEHKTSSSKILLVVTSWFLQKKIIFVRKKTPLSVSDISETYNRRFRKFGTFQKNHETAWNYSLVFICPTKMKILLMFPKYF